MLEKTKDLHPGIYADIIKTFKSSIDIIRIDNYKMVLKNNLETLYNIRDNATTLKSTFESISEKQLKNSDDLLQLTETQREYAEALGTLKPAFSKLKKNLEKTLEKESNIQKFINLHKTATEIYALFLAFYGEHVINATTFITESTKEIPKHKAVALKNENFKASLKILGNKLESIKNETLRGLGIQGGGLKSINDLEKLGIFNKDQIKQLMKNPQNNKGLSEIQQNIKNIILGGSLEEIEQDHIIKYVPKARGSKFCKDKKEAISATGKRHLILNPNKDLDELRREIMEHVLNKIV
jgi:hypothetical protein